MADVIVCIPTFRRPKGLERLLLALSNLKSEARVSLLVADNDAEAQEGLDVCLRFLARGYRWPLEAFVARERGIAQARNALVEHALTKRWDFMAMLDDDEWPDADWLEAFLRVQAATRADALHGAVVRVHEAAPGILASHCDGISDWRGASGPIPLVESTSNVIVARAALASMQPPWFDRDFGLSGGEDLDFFTRLKAQGARFAWADEAVAFAFVPRSRLSLKWALARAYSNGNSDMRVFLKHRPSAPAFAKELAKIAAALLLLPPALVIFGLAPNRAVDALRRLFRAAGKIAAVTGRRYDEYAVVHGA